MGLQRLGIAAGCALPGALAVYFAFNNGGFYPSSVALATVILSLALVVHATLAETPFSGMNKWLAVGAGGLGLFALWTALSGTWSDAQFRAFVEANRAVLYVLVVLAMAAIAGRPWRVRWVVRVLALAIAVICGVALATRLAPDTFPIAKNTAANRLSYPLNYWNTLGLFSGFGLILCLHLASSRDERRWVAVVAALATPLIATTLYFTFSRGGIVATIVGLLAYLVLARERQILLGLLAVVPGVALAVGQAYGSDLLSSDRPTTVAAAQQGHDLAPWVIGGMVLAGVLRALAIALEPRLAAVKVRQVSPRARWAAIGGVVVVVVAVAIATGVPHSLSKQYDRFLSGVTPPTHGDQRERLFDPANNGRTDLWNVAFKEFASDRLKGGGAGTFDPYWHENRPHPVPTKDGHSLYFEVIGELGIVGLLLLVTGLVALLAGSLRAARRLGDPIYAATAAVFIAWLLHAGFDWDWEMPVITAPALALAATGASGLVPRKVPLLGGGTKVYVGVGLLLVAFPAAMIYISEGKQQTAVNSYYKGLFRQARSDALSTLSVIGNRPTAYEVVGYSDLQLNDNVAAIEAMKGAVKRDPEEWRWHFDLALAQAAGRVDPRPEALRAVQLAKGEDLPRRLLKALNTKDPDVWQRAAVQFRKEYETTGQGIGKG